ncbi:MAG: HD domain-containing protein [Holophagaceae bacterium]|nr:HD domain-containing protein [Holophagaceae bacterium]
MTRSPDLRQVVHTLSGALDLVGVDDVGHGKRVGLMAAECGKRAGLTAKEVTFLFDLGMLHDIGVSSTQARHNLLTAFSSPDVQAHCDIGSRLLSGFPALASLAPGVKRHHTPWVQLVAEEEDHTLAWQANLIFLVDRVDSMAIPYHAESTTLMHAGEIRERIRQRAGIDFNPELVDLFLEASTSEAFWFALEPGTGQALLEELQGHRPTYGASMDDLRRLAEIFSRIVDAKSPFTAEHSLGVAGLASLLAEKMELGETRRAKLEIAGLLHDVGKLRVPNHILDKPGELDASEREIINTHSFETFQLLRHLHGLEDIAEWAAHHHEEPGGGGYPFRLDASTLPLEARILRIADIFQAMVQDRPYRRGLDKSQVFAFMADMAARGLAESSIVDHLAANRDEAMAAARAGVPRTMN